MDTDGSMRYICIERLILRFRMIPLNIHERYPIDSLPFRLPRLGAA